jgi:hypothetical protein
MIPEDDKGEEVRVDSAKFDDEEALNMSVATVTGGSKTADIRGFIDSQSSEDGSVTAAEFFF